MQAKCYPNLKIKWTWLHLNSQIGHLQIKDCPGCGNSNLPWLPGFWRRDCRWRWEYSWRLWFLLSWSKCYGLQYSSASGSRSALFGLWRFWELEENKQRATWSAQTWMSACPIWCSWWSLRAWNSKRVGLRLHPSCLRSCLGLLASWFPYCFIREWITQFPYFEQSPQLQQI